MGLLVAAVMLQVCFGGLAAGIAVTSSKSIEDVINLDLTTNLQEYIAHEEIRLRIISTEKKHKDEVPFVEKRLQEFKSIHQELTKNKTSNTALAKSATGNHPTSVLAVIRNFLSTWEEKLANKTKYGSRLDEFLKRRHKVDFPTNDDLYRASAVITFIENVYNISKADLVKGNIKGHQGTPLNAADCYYIGKVSMQAKMVDDSEEWMRMALKSVDLSSSSLDINKMATFNVTDAMVVLARILFKKEQRDEALQLLEKATEIDPDNMWLHKMFLAHRFGRTVETVDAVNVEPVRKEFFEICGNLSRGLSIGKRKNQPLSPRCRYKAFHKTPYWRFREEVISTYPFISLVHDFFGGKAVEAVLKVAHERAFREEPLPGGFHGQLWQSKIRTMMDFYKPLIKDVSTRVGYVTGLGVRQKKGRLSLGEPIHIIDFGPGGTYSPYRDSQKMYLPSYVGLDRGTRLTTFHLFLSDTKEGGHLVFPELNIGIKPKKGMAVIVNNFKPSGVAETNLMTGICPVLVGQSKVLQKGIFTSGLDENVLCGRKPLSTHFSVEKARDCVAGPCGAPNTYN